MRMLKRFSFLFLMSFLIFGLSGCDLFGGKTDELKAPTNFKIEDGVASWDAVEGVDGYKLTIDYDTNNITATTYDLNGLDLAVGSYQVKVAAYKGDEVSNYTNVITFTVLEPVMENLTSPSNLSLVDGVLTWDTVDQALSYDVQIGDLLIEDVTSNQLDVSTLDLYVGNYNIRVIAKRGTMVSPASNQFSYNISAVSSAEDIYAAVLASINPQYVPNMTISDFEFEHEYYKYEPIARLLLVYSNSASQMLMSSQEAVNLIQYFTNISANLGNSVDADEAKGHIDQIETFNLSNKKMVDMIMSLANVSLDIIDEELSENLEADPQAVMLVNGLKEMMTNDSDLVRKNLQNTFEFAFNFYGSISPTFLNLIDDLIAGEELSIPEIFLLKNEMVAMFKTSMPEVEEVEEMYQLMMVVAETLADIDLTLVEEYSNTFAILSHNSASLILDLIGEFGFDDFTEFQLYVENATDEYWDEYICDMYYNEITYQWEEIYCKDYHTEVNFEGFLDAVLFFEGYAQDFYNNHLVEFGNIGNELTEEFLIDMVYIFAETVKFGLQQELTLEDYNRASAIIDLVVAEVPTLLDGLEVLARIGYDEVSHFISSDAQIAYDLYDAVTSFENTEDVATFILDLEEILDQFVVYNDLLVENLTVQDVQSLMLMGRVPFIIETYGKEEYALMDTVFVDLLTPASTFMYNMLFIEDQLLTTMSTFNVSLSVSELLLLEMGYDQAALISGIFVLDQFLTTDVETAIYDNIDIMFDSILSNQTISSMLSEGTDLTVEKANIEEDFTYYIGEIKAIADFDFDNMTQVEWDRINMLFSVFGPQE